MIMDINQALAQAEYRRLYEWELMGKGILDEYNTIIEDEDDEIH